MLQRLSLDAFLFSVIDGDATVWYSCTGLFTGDDDGWTYQSASVDSSKNIVIRIPPLSCLVALVGRRHGFNFVLYNNITEKPLTYVVTIYNATYYRTFSGAVYAAAWLTYNGPFDLQYDAEFPSLDDGLTALGDFSISDVYDRYPFVVGVFMPISLWAGGMPMVSNEFYATTFYSNLINYQF